MLRLALLRPLVNDVVEQIVGRERRERVSQLACAAKGALIRAAASSPPLGGFLLSLLC